MSIQSPSKCEMRGVIRYLLWKEKTPIEIYEEVKRAYGDKAINRTSVYKWCRQFKNGRTSVHDDHRSGRPTIVTDEIVEQIENEIRADQNLTVDELAARFPQISRSLIHETVTETLGYRKLSSRWLPKHQTDQFDETTFHCAPKRKLVNTGNNPGNQCATDTNCTSSSSANVEAITNTPSAIKVKSETLIFPRTTVTDEIARDTESCGHPKETYEFEENKINVSAAKECKTSFDEESDDNSLMSTENTLERPYQCPNCSYASQDIFTLKSHVLTHTGESPYECDICHARFTQSKSLKNHRLIHVENGKFPCNLCPAVYTQAAVLRKHIKKQHNSDDPMPCEVCDEILPDLYSYRLHGKTHNDEKHYSCKLCHKPFDKLRLLKCHMQNEHPNSNKSTGTPERKHQCPYCDRSFAFNGYLIRHMEIHNEEQNSYTYASPDTQETQASHMNDEDTNVGKKIKIEKDEDFDMNAQYAYKVRESEGDITTNEEYAISHITVKQETITESHIYAYDESANCSMGLNQETNSSNLTSIKQENS